MLITQQRQSLALYFTLSLIAFQSSNVFSLVNITEWSPRTRNTCVVGGIITALAWIRLKTKPTNYDLSLSNFTKDFETLLSAPTRSLTEFTNKLLQFFDDYFIGREFKAIVVEKKEWQEDGTYIKKIDSGLKSLPFGLIGCVDAFVFMQLTKIIENTANVVKILDKMSKFVNTGKIK